jgi:hypothetical protein
LEGIKGLPLKQCYGSDNEMFVFMRPGKYELVPAKGEKVNMDVGEAQQPLVLKGSWNVTFPEDKKGPGTVVFDSLYSWTLNNEFDIRFFSGIASYEKTFEWEGDIDADNYKYVIALNNVLEVAHIFVNGEDAGISWEKPFKKDISKYIKQGKNNLKIEVANTWHNRLCGDAKLPESERITKSNITRLPNPWSYPMEKIPFDDGKEKYNLLESGLLGPVKIMAVRKMDVD